MVGIGAYAVSTNMSLVAKGPIRRKISRQAKQHLEYRMTIDVELFEDETTGELYAKVTDIKTGKSEIRKCIQTDED